MPATARSLAFDSWMTQVDREVKARLGLSVDDLPDWGFWDAWDAGTTPGEAATEILAENGVDW